MAFLPQFIDPNGSALRQSLFLAAQDLSFRIQNRGRRGRIDPGGRGAGYLLQQGAFTDEQGRYAGDMAAPMGEGRSTGMGNHRYPRRYRLGLGLRFSGKEDSQADDKDN